MTTLAYTAVTPRSILVVVGVYAVVRILHTLYTFIRCAFSPVRTLPGPRDRPSLFLGHIGLLFSQPNNAVQAQWVKTYGDTFAIRGLFWKWNLITLDPRGVTHVLSATQVYRKPLFIQKAFRRIVGNGVIVAEGDAHKDQRRIINPAFGHAQIHALTPVFLNKAAQLCDVWTAMCAEAGGTAKIDVLAWLSKTALDIIGEAGFGYDIGSLSPTGEPNELADAFERVFRAGTRSPLRSFLNDMFPGLKYIAPDKSRRKAEEAKRAMDRLGMQLISEKKRAILAETGGSAIEKRLFGGKDVLSLLMKANLAQDLDPRQRLSDEDVLAQIPTFLAAGHETTSNSLSWLFYELSHHPDVQETLRRELLSVEVETATLDVLDSLKYLDAVLLEALRVHPVILSIDRTVDQNDVIPLSAPVALAAGKTVTSLRVHKGDVVTVPIHAMNVSKNVWGPDAGDFRPERWFNLPAAARQFPGPTPGLMDFSAGPRFCVGFRFALAEMKAIVFQVIRSFELALDAAPDDVVVDTAPLTRPRVVSTGNIGMPMRITPV